MSRKPKEPAAPTAAVAPPPGLPPWVVPDGGGGCRIRVHAVPRATRTEPCGEQGGALKVRLCAPPVDGKANEALCRWAADALGVPKRAVSLVSGASSREKTVAISGVAPAAAVAALITPETASRG